MTLSVEALGLVQVLAVGYALLVREEAATRLRVAAAAGALALVFAAFSTELQTLALHTFLWAHLLVFAVPPLLGRRASRWTIFRPLVALPLWLVTYFVWHLPWVYDFALEHPHSLLPFEHASYLAAGVAVWWPVIHGAYPSGAKALYLFAAFVLASPIGLVLALVPRPVYSFYERARRTWGPGPLVDQQIAGMTMALEQAAVFFAVFARYLFRFFREEQRDPGV